MRTTDEPTDPVTTYAQAIVSGLIPANKWVKLACQRHLNDLTRTDIYFDVKRAQQHIDFFRLILKLSAGKWEGKPFILLDFQEFIQGSLFGWYYTDGRRRFETAYIEMSKGAGKSPCAAGTSIFMAIGDRTPRAECFFAASKKEQARVSFEFAVAMVDLSPLLKERFVKAGQTPCWQIADSKTGATIRPIASDDRKSGPTVHFCGIDELHEHPDDLVLSMMRQGMKGDNPLLYITTNSGTDRTSVCWQQRQQACRMLDGTIPNDSLFAYICGLDDEELKIMGLMKADHGERVERQDPIDYLLAHEELWIKANPAIGRVRSYEYVRKRLIEAKGIPAQRNRVLRLNFCVWTDAVTVWIPDSVWSACGDVSLSTQLNHPMHGRMTKLEERLLGHRCFGGIDLARNNGFSALALIFPDDEGTLSQELLDRRIARGDFPGVDIHTDREDDADETETGSDIYIPSISDPNNQVYSILEYYFIDRATFQTRAKENGIFYTWEEQGDILVYPGDAFDPGMLQDMIASRIVPRYRIEAIAYDPTFAHQLVLNLTNLKLTMVEWRQNHVRMDAPVVEVSRRAKAGLWRHRLHPVTSWMMANVDIETDHGGRQRIKKDKAAKDVDGPVAIANALGYCMLANVGVKKTGPGVHMLDLGAE